MLLGHPHQGNIFQVGGRGGAAYEECEYDGGAAGDCLHGLKKQDCDEWSNEVPDGCNEVYDCL